MWRRLAHRLRRRVAAEAAARDLNDELQFHLEMEIEHNMRSGLSSDAARAKARREIGAHGEYAGRDPSAGAAPRTPFLESLLRDLRIAFRSLLRTPAFAAVAVVTIALGVGVTTAVFSVVDGVLLRPLPYPAPERLVHVYERSATRDRMSVAGANARDIQTQVHAFSAAYLAVGDATVLGADEPLRARVAGVSREFFRVMGVAPARGRTIGEGEGLPNGPQVAVVSDAFWRTALGADPNFARRTLRVWGTTFPVVGVMPPSFAYPSRVDLWLSDADDNPSRTAHNYSVLVARLAPGVTIAGARARRCSFC
jgi:putative ABC transport system permease protein